ncbi:MAG: hypothetical protein ABSC94_29725 [Polyangiaceae bacterium]
MPPIHIFPLVQTVAELTLNPPSADAVWPVEDDVETVDVDDVLAVDDDADADDDNADADGNEDDSMNEDEAFEDPDVADVDVDEASLLELPLDSPCTSAPVAASGGSPADGPR